MTTMTEMTSPIKINYFKNILEYMEKLSYLSYLSLIKRLTCKKVNMAFYFAGIK